MYDFILLKVQVILEVNQLVCFFFPTFKPDCYTAGLGNTE